jgi:hypothetical protein
MAADQFKNQKGGINYWPVLLVLGLGAFLRLFRVGEQVILDDEWHALNAVQDHDYSWIFSHLGHADHSIPLSLLFEFFSHSIGLSEITMRAPSLLAGILAIVALPWLMRPWLKPRESAVMAALIAISPFLVNYSRIARPYSLLFLLAGASIIFAWLWWQNKDRRHGVAWVLCTVFAAWLNPVSLAVTAAPFAWFFAVSLKSILKKDYQPIFSLLLIGFAIDIGLALFLYIPFTNDFASLAVKSGLHQASANTFLVAGSLMTGSGHWLITLLMSGAAIAGWLKLSGRDRPFANYLLVIAILSTAAVLLTGAEWIIHGIVLARYLIGLQAIILALAAIGIVSFCAFLVGLLKLNDSSTTVIDTVVLLALFLAGPLPQAGAANSQFTHHMANQFDFDTERNPIRAALDPVKPEGFYYEIAALHPDGDAIIVETPWHLESNWNPLSLYQEIHHQEVLVGFVGGSCAGRLYGELRADIEGLEFKNFAFLDEVLSGSVEADYLVLRRQFSQGAREIKMDFEKCERLVRDRFGPPWKNTPSALVFKLRAPVPSGGS